MLVREDERIEPALVDEHCFLGSANGVAFRDPIVFVIYMRGDGSSTQLSADLKQRLPQGAKQQALWESDYRIVDLGDCEVTSPSPS